MPSMGSLIKALRTLVEGSLGLGMDWENDRVRIHRYADHFRVYDLTNAGKRGKAASVLLVVPAGRVEGDWFERQARMVVLNARTYDTVMAYFVGLGDEVRLTQEVARGVDVRSRKDREIEVSWGIGGDKYRLLASPLNFSVVRSAKLANGYYQDTLFGPIGRKDAEKFYAWVLDHEKELDRTDMDGFRGVWSKLGVRYDSH